jgi:hypothetical protein
MLEKAFEICHSHRYLKAIENKRKRNESNFGRESQRSTDVLDHKI